MNLKLRINLIITIILFLTLIIGGGAFTIKNARSNVQAEIASTAILAIHMLDSELVNYSSNYGKNFPASFSGKSIFQLHRLVNVRHLKIDLYDVFGNVIDSNQPIPTTQSTPKWFVKLMDSVTGEMPVTKRQVYSRGQLISELVISPDPSFEIAEVWAEIKGILMFVGIFFVAVNLLIYFSVGRALRPIDNILVALTDLESGDLKTRLPKFTLPELSKISDKFNVMADTLETSIANNHHLTQQLMQVQEDERKNLAHELHDEIGQHLTAIHVDACAILKSKTIAASKSSATAIDEVARQMMDIIHSILQRLRPTGLDELGLEPALHELVDSWSQRNKTIFVNYKFVGQFNQLNDVLLISIFRIIQECLTNISRHADAQHVRISLQLKDAFIHCSVTDDGNGFDQSVKVNGFGLAGIRERVAAVGGEVNIVSALKEGTTVTLKLPCEVGVSL